MSNDDHHPTHAAHDHKHGLGCGHTAIAHTGKNHADYLHDGHLHCPHGAHVDERVLPIDVMNPAECTPSHTCTGHDAAHVHGPDCGHERVPHGDHVDYLVDGHLHAPCSSNHCDDHGSIEL